MNVVYKKSISMRIAQAKADAMIDGREIDYIELNWKEWRQLQCELRTMPVFYEMSVQKSIKMYGLEVRKV